MTTRLEETEAKIRELQLEAGREREAERRREEERLEAEARVEKRRLAAEAEESERRRQAPLLDALEGMREASEREERLRAGTEPLPRAEPLTCYRSPGASSRNGDCAAQFSLRVSARIFAPSAGMDSRTLICWVVS